LSQVCAVLGTQWGDEGKGKLVDILAQRYDIVARCQVSLYTSIFCFFFLLLLLLSVATDLVHSFAGSLHWCREVAMEDTCPNIMECVPGSMVL